MQTFLPYETFSKSLHTLDNKRLGKQRVEAMQCVKAITVPDYRRRHHPCAQMWRGYLPALKLYHDIAIDFWIARGFVNNMVKYGETAYDILYGGDRPYVIITDAIEMPWWLGWHDFHARHRAVLKGKMPAHPAYAAFPESTMGKLPNGKLPYIWPDGEERWAWRDMLEEFDREPSR